MLWFTCGWIFDHLGGKEIREGARMSDDRGDRNAERMSILNMVESGQISTEEALQLLEALNQPEATGETRSDEWETSPTDAPQSGDWWIYPTAAGAVVMAVGAPLLALGITGRAPILLALFCGWTPFLIGLATLTIGVWSRGARWLYLRIENVAASRRTIAFGFPLPLTLSAWIMRIIRPLVPQISDVPVEEMILALRDTDGEPIYIDVQDDDDDEHVRIFIG
jgi:hypothetical protein